MRSALGQPEVGVGLAAPNGYVLLKVLRSCTDPASHGSQALVLIGSQPAGLTWLHLLDLAHVLADDGGALGGAALKLSFVQGKRIELWHGKCLQQSDVPTRLDRLKLGPLITYPLRTNDDTDKTIRKPTSAPTRMKAPVWHRCGMAARLR